MISNSETLGFLIFSFRLKDTYFYPILPFRHKCKRFIIGKIISVKYKLNEGGSCNSCK